MDDGPRSDDAEVRARLLRERTATSEQGDALARGFDDIVEAADLVATDDEHDPEGHTIAFERQQVAALRDSARVQLAELDAALERLDRGTYGRCETCGAAIGEARLAALPAARTCIGCAA